MVGFEGNNRRLPQWMLGVSDDKKANNEPVDEGFSSRTSIPDPATKKKSVRDKENLTKRPLVLAKCTTRRSKPKERPLDSDADSDVSFDEVPEKNSRVVKKVARSTSRKRRKRKKYMSSDEELDTRPLSDDEDADLTVEDLITIAEEYVRGENQTEQDRASKKVCELRRESPSTSSRNKTIDHNGAEISASYDETRFPLEMNALEASESNLRGESVVDITRTGDPAQDMLDLFLGPLLKKPAVDKKRDFPDFSRPSGIQSKTDTVREDMVPFVEKKKISLKDKVSMFFE